tara:strand:- start:1330 stop:2175 length:846 start_codon:yes stop_codon:yes gene_type:complete
MENEINLKKLFGYITNHSLILISIIILSAITGAILNNNLKSTYVTTLDYISLNTELENQRQNPFGSFFQSNAMGNGNLTKASFTYFIFSSESSDLLIKNELDSVLKAFPQLKNEKAFEELVKRFIGISNSYSDSDRLQRIIANNISVNFNEDLSVYEVTLRSRAQKLDSEKFLDLLIETSSTLYKKNIVSTLNSIIANTTNLIEKQNDLQIKDSLIAALKTDLKQLATYSSDDLPAINILSSAKTDPIAISPNLNTYVVRVFLSIIILVLIHLLYLRFKSV